jgi:DNA-binding NarL/FixJ family response regulator
MRRPRILLADDHTLFVDALRKLLEPEFEIAGSVADGRALVTAAVQLKPDVIVVDLGLPLLNGMDAGRQIKKLLPETKLLVVTMNEDAAVAKAALRQWASGYLLKKSAGSELTQAVRKLLKGESYVTSKLAQQLVELFIRDPRPEAPKRLTPRQRQVLQLLAEGRTMNEAAAILKVATRTVAFHKYTIMQDFAIHNDSELFKLAIRENLISAA